MKKFLIVLGALLAIVGGFLLYASSQPDTFEVSRETHIKAAPAVVYGYIANLKKRTAWSPWEERDPAMKKTFSGPEMGVGAIYEWSGNDDVGKGKLEITEARTNAYVNHKLSFIEPFESKADTSLSLQQKDDGVLVAWSMSGKNDLVGKVMGIFMDMDEMIGTDFEEGLRNLKAVAEKEAVPAAENHEQ